MNKWRDVVYIYIYIPTGSASAAIRTTSQCCISNAYHIWYKQNMAMENLPRILAWVCHQHLHFGRILMQSPCLRTVWWLPNSSGYRYLDLSSTARHIQQGLTPPQQNGARREWESPVFRVKKMSEDDGSAALVWLYNISIHGYHVYLLRSIRIQWKCFVIIYIYICNNNNNNSK